MLGRRIAGRLRPLARRDRWPVVAIFAVVLVGMSAVFFSNSYERPRDIGMPRGDGHYRPILATADGAKMYLSLQSLVLQGNLHVDDEARRFRYSGGFRRNAKGKIYFPHPIGPVLVWAPFFAVAQGVAHVANWFGAGIPLHGYTELHQRITLFSSVLFALGAALLGLALARRRLGGAVGPPAAAVAILLGTSVYYYAVYLPSYAHAMNAFFSGAFLCVWGLTAGQRRWERFAVLGLLLGVCALIRVAGLFLGVVLVVELAWGLVADVRAGGARVLPRVALGALGRGVLTLVVAFVLFIPQLMAWKVQVGHYFASPNGPGYVDLRRPMLVDFLWSSLNGFFSTHPLSYLSAIGLLFVPRRARMVALGLGAALLLQAYLNSCVYDWWGVASFGARRMGGTFVIQVFGLCALLRAAGIALHRLGRPLRLAIGIAVLSWFVVWNLAFARAYRRAKIDKTHPHPTCCRGIPAPLSTLAKPIYELVGNPFALPASAEFAVRYGVPLTRWDRAVGLYAGRPHFRDLVDHTPRLKRPSTWNLPGVHFDPWLLGGFGAREKSQSRWIRWTTAPHASLLLPLFLPCSYRVDIESRPNLAAGDPPMPIRVRFNGETVLERTVPARWVRLQIDLPARLVRRGMNVFEIDSVPGPYRIDRPSGQKDGLHAPHKDRRIGLALGALRVRPLDARR